MTLDREMPHIAGNQGMHRQMAQEDNNGSPLITEVLVTILFILGIIMSFIPLILTEIHHHTPSSGHPGILFAAQKPMPPKHAHSQIFIDIFWCLFFIGGLTPFGMLFFSYLRNDFDVNQCKRTKKRAHDIRCKENLGIELQTYPNKNNETPPTTRQTKKQLKRTNWT